MMKLIPQKTRPGRRPVIVGALRKIRLGMLVGVVLAGVLAVSAERREEQAARGVAKATSARPFTGPEHGTEGRKQTGTGPWLGLRGVSGHSVKPVSAPVLGSGFSSARGGPGSAWGPLGGVDNAPPFKRENVGQKVLLSQAPHRFSLIDYRPAQLPAVMPSLRGPTGTPGSVRHREND